MTLKEVYGTAYVADTVGRYTEDGCTWNDQSERRLTIKASGMGLLQLQIYIYSNDRDCDTIRSNNTHEVDFLFDDLSRGPFITTQLTGKNSGDKNKGNWQLADKGRILFLRYDDGSVRTYRATNPK
jgi:hypothetical protein